MALRPAYWMSNAVAAALLNTVGCTPTVEPEQPVQPVAEPALATGEVRQFRFEALDGSVVTTASLRGRLSFVVLAASYDTASHAQVLYLRAVVRRHVPRINALVLVLEPDHHRPLVEGFVAALDVSFPVAMVDPEAFNRVEPFPGLLQVPSVVLLDQDGREVWRRVGLTPDGQLEQALALHERSLPTLQDG